MGSPTFLSKYLLLFSCILSLGFAQTCCSLYKSVVTSTLNVRDCPETSCTQIGSLPATALAVALGEVNCNVSPNNTFCWLNVRADLSGFNLNGYVAVSSTNNASIFLVYQETICEFTTTCDQVSDWILLTDDYLQGRFDPTYYTHTFDICTNSACGFPTSPAGRGHFLQKSARTAVRNMYLQYVAENPSATGVFSIYTTHRTWDYQRGLWEPRYNSAIGTELEKVLTAASGTAMPGTSRFHWATDLGIYTSDNAQFASGNGLILYNWLVNNAHRFNICAPYNDGRDAGVSFQKFGWSHKPTASLVVSRWLKRYPAVTGFIGATAVPYTLPATFVRNINPDCMYEPCDLCQFNNTADFGALNSTLFCMCCERNCFGQRATLCPGHNVTTCVSPPPASSTFATSQSNAQSSAVPSDTDTSVPVETSSTSDEQIGGESSSPGGSNTVIIAAAAGGGGGLLLIIFVAVLVVYLARRNKGSGSRGSTRDYPLDAKSDGSTEYTGLPRKPKGDGSNSEYQNMSLGLNSRTQSFVKFPTFEKNSTWEIDFSEIAVEKEIGSGAFGIVYKAVWRKQVVAVKKLFSGKKDEEFITEFLKELEVMRKLRPHKNIVQLLGICPNPLCVITSFHERGSLYNYLRTNAEFDNKSILRIAKDICAGMSHLHAENIVHRDLAARNVLLGKDLEAVVADFGMSRTIEFSGSGKTTRSDVGPVRWMAVECIMLKVYSKKSDVWSFGVTLYELYARQDPWAGMDLMDVAFAVRDGKRLSPPPNCPPEVKEIMKKCFDTAPENRPDFDDLFETFEKMERKL